MSNNYYLDNDDLRFYVEKAIDWEPLVRLTERDFKSADAFENTEEALTFYKDALEMFGKFVANEIGPRIQELDTTDPEIVDGQVRGSDAFEAIFEKAKELGLHMLAIPRELGGMNAPLVLYMMNSELMARADASTMTHFGFHGGIALALLVYSIHEGTTTFNQETLEIEETRFVDAIQEIMMGEAWGSMDITEPNAGSDMAALRTRGFQDEDGNWFVTGQKIFITSGHGKYHIVIARTEDSDDDGPMAGLKGLSTFLVRGYEDTPEGRVHHVTVDRLEEKLGHHASPTCSVIFENAPAELIGERGEGFKHMLLLMNNARIGVGFECIGICEAAQRLARDYAAERGSMGKTIDKHEMIAEFLEDMDTETRAIRALAVTAVYNEEMAQKIGMMLEAKKDIPELERARLEKELARCKRLTRRVTPLLKYHASEKAVEFAKWGIQIHGGVGYTKEYGAEKLLRDAMVMPIYEGTSQIQGLMAMKDTLGGIMKRPQKFMRKLADARWRSLSERDPRARSLAKLQYNSLSAQQHLVMRTARDKFDLVRQRPLNEWADELRHNWDPKRDFSYAMLHAERLIRLLIDEAIAEILYDQMIEFPEREELFDRFVEIAEPRSRYNLDILLNRGQRLLDKLHGTGEEDDQTAAAE